MSQEPLPNPYSKPASGGGLLLRAVFAGGLVITVIVGIVWYVTSK